MKAVFPEAGKALVGTDSLFFYGTPADAVFDSHNIFQLRRIEPGGFKRLNMPVYIKFTRFGHTGSSTLLLARDYGRKEKQYQ